MNITVNLNKLRKKAADIRNAVEKLTTLATQTVEEYLKDHKSTAASKYYLLVAAEAAIDICNHLAARLARRAPDRTLQLPPKKVFSTSKLYNIIPIIITILQEVCLGWEKVFSGRKTVFWRWTSRPPAGC